MATQDGLLREGNGRWKTEEPLTEQSFSGCKLFGSFGESNFRSVARNGHFIGADSVHHNNLQFLTDDVGRSTTSRVCPLTEVRQNHFSAASGNGLWRTCTDYFGYPFAAEGAPTFTDQDKQWLVTDDHSMQDLLECLEQVAKAGAATSEACPKRAAG